MRRTTLGTMNIGNKSRVPAKEKAVVRPRSSFGLGGRLSNPGPRTSGAARPKTSFGSSRRSSQYGRDSYTQIKDPRPLSDKAYQQKEIKDILQFLSENDYQHPISMKTMMIPTSKEFLKVFAFLYSRVSLEDTYKKLMEKKPEEEVPKILKSLGYPFTIHKTSLSNVGSPHTWPILLGALHWLMDVVKFAMAVNDDVEQCLFPAVDGDGDGDDYGASMNRVYFDYLEKTYEQFINGMELENLGEYTDALLEELQSQNGPIFTEVEELSQGNLRLEEELKSLENDSSRLEALTERRNILETDKVTYEGYIADLRRHHVRLEERRVQSAEKLDIAKLELEATLAEKTRLEKILANQELSAADVQRMRQKSEELKKALSKLEGQRDSLDEEIWEKEMSYARRHEQVGAQCQDYNERARKLKLVPSSAENAAGVDYELRFHHGRMTLDVKEQLKPSLMRFKKQISDCSSQRESEMINLRLQHDLLQEKISESEEQIKMFEGKIAALEKEIEWKKQEYDEQQNILDCEVEEMQHKIDSLRLQNQTEISKKRRQLEEAKESLKKKTSEMAHERKQYEMFLSAACELVIEHKTIIQNRIGEIRKDMDDFTEIVSNLPAVTSQLLSKDEIDATLAEDEGEKTEDEVQEAAQAMESSEKEEKPKEEAEEEKNTAEN